MESFCLIKNIEAPKDLIILWTLIFGHQQKRSDDYNLTQIFITFMIMHMYMHDIVIMSSCTVPISPYNISIIPVNSAGKGDIRKLIVYTKEIGTDCMCVHACIRMCVCMCVCVCVCVCVCACMHACMCVHVFGIGNQVEN